MHLSNVLTPIIVNPVAAEKSTDINEEHDANALSAIAVTDEAICISPPQRAILGLFLLMHPVVKALTRWNTFNKYHANSNTSTTCMTYITIRNVVNTVNNI